MTSEKLKQIFKNLQEQKIRKETLKELSNLLLEEIENCERNIETYRERQLKELMK